MRTIALLCASQLIWAQAPERVPWLETTQRFAGLEVEVKRISGRPLKGAWVAVTADSFTIKTRKGTESFPRVDIQQVKTHRRTVRRRTIGAIVGYVSIGAVLGENIQGPLGLLLPVAGTLGFILGRELDRDTRVIEIE